MKLEFEDIEAVTPDIWTDGRESFWIQKVWEILDKANKTSYDTEEEALKIKLLAVSAAALYLDFCEIVFDERGYYRELYDDVTGSELFNENEILFLYGRLSQEDFPDSPYDALFEMENESRKKLLAILTKHMSIAEICMGLFYTVANVSDDDYFMDDEDADPEDFSPFKGFDTYTGYWNLITGDLNEMIDNASSDMGIIMPGYEWLDNGAEQIGAFE